MLPTINAPTYDLTIPSTNESVKFRPFLVKEEKILLMAQEGEELQEKIDAIKQIIGNCLVSDVNVDKLSTFDIEHIFIKLRSKSIGNVIGLSYNREDCTEEGAGQGGCQIPFTLDLEKAEIENQEGHTNELNLTSDIKIIMKYPDFNILNSVLTADSVDDVIDVVATCIDMIVDGSEVYNASDYSESELKTFVENLTQQQFESINNFFNTMPETACDVNIVCRKCGWKKSMKVKGITDFFS